MISIIIGIFLFVGIGVFVLLDEWIKIIQNFKYGYLIVMFYIFMVIFLIYGYTHYL